MTSSSALTRLWVWTAGLTLVAGIAAAELSPNPVPGLRTPRSLFPRAQWDPAIPSPESILGFPVARRAATPDQITACLEAWAATATNRCRLIRYATSHEGRPLHYLIITSPENLARLDAIQKDLQRLGDPRATPPEQADRLIETLPAVAWFGATIHGDETEGSDAALALAHYLIASNDDHAARLRHELVIIIDPLMNPDGRNRFLKMIAEHRGASPNVDDQSLLHTGYWPRGRGNHYLFDLNRDAILGVHPETRGRVRAIAAWNPVVLIDAHGMGPQETHLFSPPREPINPNIPSSREHWGALFARDQARAFDRHGLLYYNGEWHEEWYPGYTDGYASYRGAIGILYEQARIAEDGVRRPEGRVLSYTESVQHHVIGALANLTTTADHRAELLRNFYEVRREAVSPEGPYANRTFVLLPHPNTTRRRALLDVLQWQGFEMLELRQDWTVPQAVDQLGHTLTNAVVPAGSILLPNRQPLAHLLAAMLEFDPRYKTNVLAEERQELLLKGRSKIYDTTAWNLTMFYGLPAWTVLAEPPQNARPWRLPHPPAGRLRNRGRPVAWVFNGADDASVTAAARLMERGVQVRLADKPFTLDGKTFPRGSVVVATLDNRDRLKELPKLLQTTAAETGLDAFALSTGFGEGDLPDLGSEHFRRLERPRIALVGREETSPYDFGAIWHLLDTRLRIRHSHLDGLAGRDLRRYNLIILPDGRPELPDTLKDWVRQGGTLIAIGRSTTRLTAKDAGWSSVRLLPDVLDDLDAYELTIFREWLGAQAALPPTDQVWAHTPAPELPTPWKTFGGKRPGADELKRLDRWQSLFMPQGAFIAARVDTNHWLTAGCDPWMPILVGGHPLLMAKDGVQAPVRYGLFEPAPPQTAGQTAPDGDQQEAAPAVRRIGWAALPPGTQLRLRLSGLLWPEAAHRLANAAWCTRERFGRGQIILFATPPAFRGTARATDRILLNAIVYGPGWTTPPIQLPREF
ncbi:MAG: peptidase [Verrucomicrobia bacterium]|nr:MAG: peptidase [Verrucomicrobiota bacterium]